MSNEDAYLLDKDWTKGEERKAFAAWIKASTVAHISDSCSQGIPKETAIKVAEVSINKTLSILNESIRINLTLAPDETNPGFTSLIWNAYYIDSSASDNDGFPELASKLVM